jgi:hypothetical protein
MKNGIFITLLSTLFLCTSFFLSEGKAFYTIKEERLNGIKNDPPSNKLGEQLWKAQHLNGTQDEWFANGGGGEFNSGTGFSSASSEVARSGDYSLKMEINTSSGSGHATRNYRWNEISRNDDLIFTQYFYFPNRIDFDRNNDWFNLIQTKGVKFAPDGAGTGPDQINLPHFVLGLEVRGGTGTGGPNYLSLADLQKFWGSDKDRVWKAPNGVNLPTKQWVKVQIRLIQDRGDKGRVLVYQDDQLIIDTGYLNTLKPEVDTNMYSVNAYADKTYPNITKIFVDDLSINLPALEENEVITPNPPNVKLNQPKENSTITLGESVKIETTIDIPEGNEIMELAFYKNKEKIGTSTGYPHSFQWTPKEIGNFSIKAVAKDIFFQENESQIINIKVLDNKSIETKIENDNAFRINLGGNSEIEHNGFKYIADREIVNFQPEAFTFSNLNASKQAIFQTERNHTNLNLEIPIENGNYTVKTYHNELWFGKEGPKAQKGKRVFDIYIQNEIKIEDFDIYEFNQNKPTVLTFENIEVKNNTLLLSLIAKTNRGTISGISIISNNPAENDNLNKNKSIHLNSGSSNYVEYNGDVFTDMDGKWVDSQTYTFENKNSSKEELFTTERNGLNINYKIPLPNGEYLVRTHHNELWFGQDGPDAKIGRRVFDININGETKVKDFDIFKESNNNPTTLTFEDIIITDGILNLNLKASNNRASISGLSIIPINKEIIEESAINALLDPVLINTGEKISTQYESNLYISELELPLTFSPSFTYINRRTSREQIFQSERNATNLKYEIPVPNGEYEIRTYHNELWFGQEGPSAQLGRRVFDIEIENVLVRENIDLFKENNNNPTVLEFKNIKVKDGVLNINLIAKSNRATISGIAIIPIGQNLRMENLRGYREMGNKEIIKYMDKNTTHKEQKLFPNPAYERINYKLEDNSKVTDIALLDLNGNIRKIWRDAEIINIEKNIELDISSFKNGLYILNIYSENGQIEKHKLLIRK